MGRKNIQMYRNRFHCPICKRGFMMEWAKNNCHKKCKDMGIKEVKG